MNYKQLCQQLDTVQAELKAAQDTANNKMTKLKNEYAFQSNQVKMEDVISDGSRSIVVSDMIVLDFGNILCEYPLPKMVYRGVLLSKKGVPCKDGRTGVITIGNIKTINGKPYSELQNL